MSGVVGFDPVIVIKLRRMRWAGHVAHMGEESGGVWGTCPSGETGCGGQRPQVEASSK